MSLVRTQPDLIIEKTDTSLGPVLTNLRRNWILKTITLDTYRGLFFGWMQPERMTNSDKFIIPVYSKARVGYFK